ncbi:MAG: radical SAM protein [Candidatus Nealsonbacteria bacterium]|nr:radical SAM protein [Candidatus Nealsonbacteria bacterium]
MIPKIRISVSDRCQMKCVYCGGEGALMENFGPKRETLCAEDLLKIIRCGLEARFFKKVHFTGGEPLLRPDLISLIGSTVKMGGEVELNTNGLALTERRVRLLKKAGCSLLKVSLDCATRKEFYSITGFDGFEKVIKSIDIASKIMPVRVNCVVMQQNLRKIVPLIDLMNKLKVPRIHLLDLTYYPFPGSKTFWEEEFVYLSREVQSFFEKKIGKKFKEMQIFGCYFSELLSKNEGTIIVLKEANPTMRSPSICSPCQNYCHEGVFTLRLSTGGYLNICPFENNLGVDALSALKKGILIKEYEKFSEIFDETEQVNSFPTFLNRNNLKLKERGELDENMLSSF